MEALSLSQLHISPGDNLLLAVSGGPDSMALLDMVNSKRDQLDFSFSVAHVNYGTREQSLLEEETLRHYCLYNNIPFFSKKVNLPHTNSFEEKARDIRYNFFRELSISFGFNKLLTAHNQDDQAETVLIRLFRGTGPKGARGISEVSKIQSLTVIRPLLKISKADLEEYCKDNWIPYFIDQTNQTSIYNRNFIRNNILPPIKKRYPRANENICRFSRILNRENNFNQDIIKHFFKKWTTVTENTVRIERRLFKEENFFESEGFEFSKATKRYIVESIIRKAFNQLKSLKDIEERHVNSVIELFGKNEGKIDLPHGFIARVVSGNCEIALKDTDPEPFSEYQLGYLNKTKNFYFTKEAKKLKVELNPTKTLNQILIDRDKIKNPVTLRSKRPGDKVYPVGMTGSKKLSRFFIDKKIPVNLRDSIPVLASEETIIWIPDLYINRNYIVDESTTNILGLSLENLNERE